MKMPKKSRTHGLAMKENENEEGLEINNRMRCFTTQITLLCPPKPKSSGLYPNFLYIRHFRQLTVPDNLFALHVSFELILSLGPPLLIGCPTRNNHH